MADLAPITAKVVASASGMAGGLADAEKKLKASTGKMAKEAKKDGKKAGKSFREGIVEGIGQALGNQLAAAAGGLLAAATGAGVTRMLEVGKAARQAGADVAGFQVVVEALDNDLGVATEGLVKLKEALGKALVEGQDEVFGMLGLDPAELLGMRDDQALAAVAGRLRELGGGVAEARTGVELFADQFKTLRPILDDGGELLGRTAERLEQFGAAFGENDFLAARQWRDAVNQISLLWKGLQNEVGKGLLPIVATLSKRLGSLADHGVTFKGLSGKVVDAAERIAKAGALVYDVWSDTDRVMAALDLIDAKLHLTTERLLFRVAGFFPDLLTRAFAGLTGKVPAALAVSVAGLLGPAAAAMTGELKKAETELEIAAGAFDLLMADAAGLEAVGSLFEEVRDAARDMAGSVDAAGRATADLWGLWEEGAERLGKALDGPVDRFEEAVKRVRALAELGRRASEELVWAGFDVDPFDDGLGESGLRTLAKAFGQLKGAFAPPELRFAGAMLAGSREAYSAAVRHQAQATGRESVEQALKRIMEAQLRQQEEEVKLGREVAAATKALAAKLRVGGI